MKRKTIMPWRRLDNAAKIFPHSYSKRDPKVFRFACELREPVREHCLQQALDETVRDFPHFQSVLKHGMFWLFLENSALHAEVKEEYRTVCSQIFSANRKSLLFDVTYYQNRINLEVYHVLTDGTGALEFLRSLVCHYLVIRYEDELPPGFQLPDIASPRRQEEDSFSQYYTETKKAKAKMRLAYHRRGLKLPDERLRVIEGVVSASSVLELARRLNTTITVLLTSLLTTAIEGERGAWGKSRPVVLSVPVNLRKHFPSESMRNFFATVNIPYDDAVDRTNLEQVITYTRDIFQENITKEKLAERMNAFGAWERYFLVRAVPLPIKDVVLRFISRMADVQVSGAISNLGQVSMPEVLTPYIRLFDIMFSSDKLQICLCSFGDEMVISFTAPFAEPAVQRRFFRSLVELGIEVTIVSDPFELGHKEGRS